MRHGDRTPKQKVKFFFSSKVFLDLVKDSDEELVFKKIEQFEMVMTAVREALIVGEEDKACLEQILNILEAKGKQLGTKVQLRPLFDKSDNVLRRIQLIVKWGGLFTHGMFQQTLILL
jgi:hypothetical protein